jgi:hypothetical protein
VQLYFSDLRRRLFTDPITGGEHVCFDYENAHANALRAAGGDTYYAPRFTVGLVSRDAVLCATVG